jgi:hypothetical protein
MFRRTLFTADTLQKDKLYNFQTWNFVLDIKSTFFQEAQFGVSLDCTGQYVKQPTISQILCTKTWGLCAQLPTELQLGNTSSTPLNVKLRKWITQSIYTLKQWTF